MLCLNFFLSLLTVKFSIKTDRMVHTPGHGKHIIDDINVVDKRFNE